MRGFPSLGYRRSAFPTMVAVHDSVRGDPNRKSTEVPVYSAAWFDRSKYTVDRLRELRKTHR